MKVSSPVNCVIYVGCLLQLAVSWDSLRIRNRPAPGVRRPDGGVLLLRKAHQGPGLPRVLKRSRAAKKTGKTKATNHPVGLLKQQILSSMTKSEQVLGVKVSD
jgi:hypothetical protein